jgi:hypothetical protein
MTPDTPRLCKCEHDENKHLRRGALWPCQFCACQDFEAADPPPLASPSGGQAELLAPLKKFAASLMWDDLDHISQHDLGVCLDEMLDKLLTSQPPPAPASSALQALRRLRYDIGTVSDLIQRPNRELTKEQRDQVAMLAKWIGQLDDISAALTAPPAATDGKKD